MGKIFLCLLLAAAAWAEPPKIVGAWVSTAKGQTQRMVLNEDGTGTLNGAALRWSYENGLLWLRTANSARTVPATVTDTTLTLRPVGQQPLVFQREKAANAPSTRHRSAACRR